MDRPGPDPASTEDARMEEWVPGFQFLAPADQERLRQMASELAERGMPAAFIVSSLRSTAEVLTELRGEAERPDNALQREHVQRFIEQNAVPESTPGRYQPQREWKRQERERLQANVTRLLREARLARGRHEVKKTRNMLLKIDQRELRRRLGSEGDDLCRQINTWLRSTAAMF